MSELCCLLPCCDQTVATVPTCSAAMTTACITPSQGTATNANSGTGLEGLICSLDRVGITVAGAVTGRPVTTNKQGIPTLGNKPVVTGQISANELVVIGGIALVVIALILANRN